MSHYHYHLHINLGAAPQAMGQVLKVMRTWFTVGLRFVGWVVIFCSTMALWAQLAQHVGGATPTPRNLITALAFTGMLVAAAMGVLARYKEWRHRRRGKAMQRVLP